MITLRSQREIDLLRTANQTVAKVLTTLADRIKPGVKIIDLDREAESIIRDSGGTPSFLGYHGFPASTCISVDEVVIHGIPDDRVLQENEICSIDVGVNYKGYFGDAALSIPCGKVNEERKRLMRVTERSLAAGIDAARVGNRIHDISKAIETVILEAGLGIVRDFVGHGVGSEMHEEPQIPNYVTSNKGPKLKAGMVLALEPMVNLGVEKVEVLDDGWTAVTEDRKPSAHFEHSIVIQPEGPPEILSKSPNEHWRWGESEGLILRGEHY